MKPPPQFSKLIPFVSVVNEFEDMPPTYVPMARLVMATLISKAQDLMKGQPQDAACTAFINHLIDAFTAMKSKITKDAAEASRPVLAKVASKCFKVADDQDRAGEATRETAKDFNKARCMFETLLSAPVTDESHAEDWNQKRLYAMKKAAEIEKAFARGQKPVAGNPEHDWTLENMERQLREAQDWLAQHASSPPEERAEYETRVEQAQRALPKLRQIFAASAAAPPAAASGLAAAGAGHSHPPPASPPAYPPPSALPPPALGRPPSHSESPLQYARQTVSALQFDDIREGLRNIQGALRMLKGQEPVVDFAAEPERGRIFDAEDAARHAVSALKFDDQTAAVRCLEETLRHLTVSSR